MDEGPIYSNNMLLERVTTDANGNSLGKTEDGEWIIGLRAKDTGELVTTYTVSKIAQGRAGIEPIDEHDAYWERRYRARRFARRLGVLPTYSDLFEAYKRLYEAADRYVYSNGPEDSEPLIQLVVHPEIGEEVLKERV